MTPHSKSISTEQSILENKKPSDFKGRNIYFLTTPSDSSLNFGEKLPEVLVVSPPLFPFSTLPSADPDLNLSCAISSCCLLCMYTDNKSSPHHQTQLSDLPNYSANGLAHLITKISTY